MCIYLYIYIYAYIDLFMFLHVFLQIQHICVHMYCSYVRDRHIYIYIYIYTVLVYIYRYVSAEYTHILYAYLDNGSATVAATCALSTPSILPPGLPKIGARPPRCLWLHLNTTWKTGSIRTACQIQVPQKQRNVMHPLFGAMKHIPPEWVDLLVVRH